MKISKITVLGAGNMGHGIARTCAIYGFDVSVADVNKNVIIHAKNTIEDDIAKHFVAKGKMTAAKADQVKDRLHYIENVNEAVSDTDILIEAIFEDLNLKKRVFAELDDLCPQHTIFASNTSYLSITGMASATKRPDKVIGMHFFSPPDVNPLIEIAPGLSTSEETVETLMVVCEKMGKKPMRVKDTPGFVVNRFINAIYSEAARTVQNGVATAEQIDYGVKHALGFRLGPCEMMDYTGLELLASGVGRKPQFADLYLLQRMVDAGRYGRKNGRGFYDYHEDGTKTLADLSNIAGK